MKKNQLLIVLLLISLTFHIGLSTATGAERIWNGEEAVVFALKNSPDSAIAQKKIEAANALVRQSRSGNYPRINLSSSYTQTNNPMYSFGNILNQQEFTTDIDFNDPGVTDNLQLKAELKYRLFNGGTTQASIEAAEALREGAELKLQATHNRLAFEVVRFYHMIIQAEEMVHARKSGIEAIEASLAVAKARYDAGDLLKQNLLNIQLQKARAQEELISANHTLALAKRGFATILGLDDAELSIKATDSDRQERPAVLDMENRPELKQMASLIRAAEANVKKAERTRYPSIDGFANYQVNSGTVTDGSGDSWMAGIRIDYLLFDGNNRNSSIEKAKAQLLVAKEQKRKLMLNINLEIEQARLKLTQSEERLKVTENMVGTAIESARLTRARFKEGVVLASELIDAENRLTEAHVLHSSANAMQKIAIAELRRALGLTQFN